MKTILSVDCETNGRVPGKHSMIQVGAVAFNMTGKEISHFVMNLIPMFPPTKNATMQWWSEQPKEMWDRVTENAQHADVVCKKFADWIAQFNRPKMLFAPTMFDGLFVRWYMDVFVGRSILWHSALDLRSVLWSYTGDYETDYQKLIPRLAGVNNIENPTPHYAVSDARFQGQLFFLLCDWARRVRLKG